MKTKKLSRRLSLKKQTVTHLNNDEQRNVKAGQALAKSCGIDCVSIKYSCNITGCAPCPPTECALPSQDVYTCSPSCIPG
jgi:hypothetical protein